MAMQQRTSFELDCEKWTAKVTNNA